jgi:hypothetical protein
MMPNTQSAKAEIKELTECIQVINYNLQVDRGDRAQQMELMEKHLDRIIELKEGI